ncbi:DUF7263 family protein [Natronomonas marina]|uniref:DUF7263 family protein n=1 Tax=Natronomonas marina TaxID=2961939 RepID=UPI0020CA0197|nr:hypothetical protein [Natronomonas marina]
MRGQANLPALAIALLVVTTTTGLAVVIADGAFASAERSAGERATATAVADRLLAPDSPLTDRANVLNASRLTAANVEGVVPSGAAVRVAVDGRPVYERGNPTGPTARRLAIVAERQAVTLVPPLEFESVTLPRRSPRATVDIDPSADVRTVRANDRVVLHDPDGVVGSHEVNLSRYETTKLRFEGEASEGEVAVTYYPRRTTKARLEVTVGA